MRRTVAEADRDRRRRKRSGAPWRCVRQELRPPATGPLHAPSVALMAAIAPHLRRKWRRRVARGGGDGGGGERRRGSNPRWQCGARGEWDCRAHRHLFIACGGLELQA